MMRKLITGLLAALALQSVLAATLPEVTVYKDPNCGCCTEWAKHMQASGFTVKQVNSQAMDVERQRFGVPPHLASCHTAKVGGYTVEGHVPASAVKKMLAEKPSIQGLTIPGMPANAPGMGQHREGTLKVYTLPKAGESSRIYSVE
nr:DUF411 domain-containing protein [Dechloromonas sp. CZR5]